jgi:hypothetical protein
MTKYQKRKVSIRKKQKKLSKNKNNLTRRKNNLIRRKNKKTRKTRKKSFKGGNIYVFRSKEHKEFDQGMIDPIYKIIPMNEKIETLRNNKDLFEEFETLKVEIYESIYDYNQDKTIIIKRHGGLLHDTETLERILKNLNTFKSMTPCPKTNNLNDRANCEQDKANIYNKYATVCLFLYTYCSKKYSENKRLSDGFLNMYNLFEKKKNDHQEKNNKLYE